MENGKLVRYIAKKDLRCRHLKPGLDVSFEIPAPHHAPDIGLIVQDWRVICPIGEGAPWEDAEVSRKIDHWRQCWRQPEGKRDCMTWLAMCKSEVAAIVQIRRQRDPPGGASSPEKDLFSGEWFVVFLVAKRWQRLGIGSSAVEICCRAFAETKEGGGCRLLAMCSDTNAASAKCLTYAGFQERHIKVPLGQRDVACRIFVREPFPSGPAGGTPGDTTGPAGCKTAGGGARGGACRTRSSAPPGKGLSRQ